MRKSVKKIIIIWKVGGGEGVQEKKCHLEFKIPIWWTQRVSTAIVLLVICLDRMQMWRSIGPGVQGAIDLR